MVKMRRGVVQGDGKIKNMKGESTYMRVDPIQDWRPMVGHEVEFVEIRGLPLDKRITKRRRTTTGSQGYARILQVLGKPKKRL